MTTSWLTLTVVISYEHFYHLITNNSPLVRRSRNALKNPGFLLSCLSCFLSSSSCTWMKTSAIQKQKENLTKNTPKWTTISGLLQHPAFSKYGRYILSDGNAFHFLSFSSHKFNQYFHFSKQIDHLLMPYVREVLYKLHDNWSSSRHAVWTYAETAAMYELTEALHIQLLRSINWCSS